MKSSCDDMQTAKRCIETERLAFDLTSGEQRFFVSTKQSWLCCARRDPEKTHAAGAVLFVHGAASNGSRWEEFVEKTRLGNSWTLLRLDLRRHGASEGLRLATLERHADDLAAVLETAGVGSAFLVGHSLGAQISLAFARRHPDLLRGLVLIDPLIDAALTEKARNYSKKKIWLSLLEFGGRALDAIGFSRKLPKYSLRHADEVARQKLAEGGSALAAFVREYSSPWTDLKFMHAADYARDLLEVARPTGDVPPRLFNCPVLVMASRSGVYTECDKLEAWTQSFGGDFAVLDCVHWPLTECPSEIDVLLDEWFAKCAICAES